jgi:hypothetical protein
MGALTRRCMPFLGTCARRAAELRVGGSGSVSLASRLIIFLTIVRGLFEARSICSVAKPLKLSIMQGS